MHFTQRHNANNLIHSNDISHPDINNPKTGSNYINSRNVASSTTAVPVPNGFHESDENEHMLKSTCGCELNGSSNSADRHNNQHNRNCSSEYCSSARGAGDDNDTCSCSESSCLYAEAGEPNILNNVPLAKTPAN